MLEIDKQLSRAALIIPAIYFTTCAIFIAGYTFGFGSNIGHLFSISDFFTIIIQQLFWAYLGNLVLPAIIFLFRYRSGYIYATDMLNEITDVPKKQKFTHRIKITQLAFLFIFGMLFALGTVGLILQILTSAQSTNQVWIVMILTSLTPLIFSLSGKLSMQIEAAWLVFIFLVSVFSMGIDTGDHDRRAPYASIYNRFMKCQDLIVLRPIGDRYIAVGRDNRRFIVNDRCEIVFTVPVLKVFSSKSALELGLKKFRNLYID